MLSIPKIIKILINNFDVGCFACLNLSSQERAKLLRSLQGARAVPDSIESVAVLFDEDEVLHLTCDRKVTCQKLGEFYRQMPCYLNQLVASERFSFPPPKFLLDWEREYCQSQFGSEFSNSLTGI